MILEKRLPKEYLLKLDFTDQQKSTIKKYINLIDANNNTSGSNHGWLPVNIDSWSYEKRTNKDAAGYNAALDYILSITNKEWKRTGLTETIIHKIHSLILNGEKAGYRIDHKTNNPLFAFVIETQIKNLIDFINTMFRNKSIHPLLIISLFSYEFLILHPFRDGNGRTSRILIALLLLRNGYNFITKGSLENYFNQYREIQFKCFHQQSLINSETKEIKVIELKKPTIYNWSIFLLNGFKEISKN